MQYAHTQARINYLLKIRHQAEQNPYCAVLREDEYAIIIHTQTIKDTFIDKKMVMGVSMGEDMI